jgi:hypothetical protein
MRSTFSGSWGRKSYIIRPEVSRVDLQPRTMKAVRSNRADEATLLVLIGSSIAIRVG